MPLLVTQFQKALRNIEPTQADKDNAPEAHWKVREVLLADDTLSGWGLDPILIGSYKRAVSIRRMKDVDVLGQLRDLPEDVEPKDLLNEFERVLVAEFGWDRVARQARSLQVSFPDLDGLYVDAVPARPWTSEHGEDAWQLPKREENGWQATNPDQLTTLKTELNAEFDGLYVPVVKLLRQTRRSLMGDRKPGGLTIEIAALHAFQSGEVSGSNVSQMFVSALRKTGEILYAAFVLNGELADPTLINEPLLVRGSDADKIDLATAFVDAGDRAQAALDAGDNDKGTAAKTFQDILGTAVDDVGSDDYVFPMPDDCNADGTRKQFAQVRAGDAQVAGGDRRFG